MAGKIGKVAKFCAKTRTTTEANVNPMRRGCNSNRMGAPLYCRYSPADCETGDRIRLRINMGCIPCTNPMGNRITQRRYISCSQRPEEAPYVISMGGRLAHDPLWNSTIFTLLVPPMLKMEFCRVHANSASRAIVRPGLIDPGNCT